MAQTHSRIRERLEKAERNQNAVRLTRSPKHADWYDVVVLAIGKKWLLCVQVASGGYLGEYKAFRLRDIRSVKKDPGFSDRALPLQPDWPPSLPAHMVGLDRTRDVVLGLGAEDTLIGIEKEHQREAIWIGVVALVDKHTLWLQEINPQADWTDEPLGYRLGAITAVTAGGRYLTALQAVGGDPPPVVPRDDDPE